MKVAFTKKFLFIQNIFLLLLLTGCATVQIQSDFYKDNEGAAKKIPLRAALVENQTMKSQSIHMSDLMTWDIKLQPGLTNSIHSALKSTFQEVIMVDNTNYQADIDIFILPQYTVLGQTELYTNLSLEFIDSKTTNNISRFQQQQVIPYKLGAGGFISAILTGGTLFIGAPIFMPLGAQAQASKYQEIIEKNIESSLHLIIEDIKRDYRLREFAQSKGKATAIKITSIETKDTSTEKLPDMSYVDKTPIIEKSLRVIGPNDVAIVIGIEKYQNIPKSEYSNSDAKLVKNYFKALGFQERNIEILTDERATRTSIEKTVEGWLPNRLKKNSKVFVYYSGHGSHDPSTGDAYIVPYDGDPNYLSMTGYPLKRLYSKLGGLDSKEIIVILDSCFSGAGGRSVLALGARPLVMNTESLILPSNLAVLTATQGSQISTSSPEKEHGIFTYYFLKAIKDGKKNLAEIYEYITPLIEDEAKMINVQQSPSINPNINALVGRFYLRK